MRISLKNWSAILGLFLVFALAMPTIGYADEDEWEDDDSSVPAEVDDDDWEDDVDDVDDADDDDDDDCDDDDLDDDDCYEFRDIALPDQAIVQLTDNTNIETFVQDHRSTVLSVVPNHNVALIALAPDMDDQTQVNALVNDERVVWSELNYTSQAPEGRPRYFFTSTATTSGFVDAPALPAGFEFTSPAACVDGEGIIVAVLDTGLDVTHPHFAGATILPGWNTLENSEDINDAANGIDDDFDGMIDEMVGHGTHVTGSLLMVAPGVQILPYKVLDSDGVGSTFSVTAGIYRAVDEGADVINLSLGSTFDSVAIREAIAYARANDVAVVAAAGNSSQYTPTEFPAAIPEVVSVASVDETGDKASYSNFHESVDISAPGNNVASAYPEGQYLVASGTSMSTPLVSGTLVLVMERNPGMSSIEAETLLKEQSSPLNLGDPLLEGIMGAGEVNVDAAIDCDAAEPTPTGSIGDIRNEDAA